MQLDDVSSLQFKLYQNYHQNISGTCFLHWNGYDEFSAASQKMFPTKQSVRDRSLQTCFLCRGTFFTLGNVYVAAI